MKLNCDLGESFGHWVMGDDALVMPHIDMANIACGFHASDPNIMHQTLKLAKLHEVEVGAHPGYQDLAGFGRRSIPHSKQEIINLLQYQVGALNSLASAQGITITYVKPHGALYNDMMAQPEVLESVLTAIAQLNNSEGFNLKLMMLATAKAEIHKALAAKSGVRLILEAFADRRYDDDGHLLSRGTEGAVLNEQQMLQQVGQLARDGYVETASGKRLNLNAQTLCVHGDNEAGIKQIQQIRALLAS